MGDPAVTFQFLVEAVQSTLKFRPYYYALY